MSWFWWLNLVLTVPALLYWFRGINQGFCFHRWVLGAHPILKGALRCSKCERVQYPEKMKLRKLYRLLGRIHKEHDHAGK